MRIFKKKNKAPKAKAPEPIYYPILLGQEVTLTITGIWDGQKITTPGNSWFTVSRLQTDPAVWVEPCEDII